MAPNRPNLDFAITNLVPLSKISAPSVYRDSVLATLRRALSLGFSLGRFYRTPLHDRSRSPGSASQRSNRTPHPISTPTRFGQTASERFRSIVKPITHPAPVWTSGITQICVPSENGWLHQAMICPTALSMMNIPLWNRHPHYPTRSRLLLLKNWKPDFRN